MRRLLITLLGVVVMAVAGCGGGSGPAADGGAIVDDPAVDSPFLGGQVLPLQPAPEIGLRSSTGKLVRLADMRGKIVMVTFVYARCPDICQVIVESMRAAKLDLGARGSRVELVAVSVDPEHDTPKLVNEFRRRHRVADSLQYVVGSRSRLESVWRDWGVAAQENFDNPELVEHSGVVWLMDAQGNRAVYVPLSEVTVKTLVHDATVLLDRA